jgi:hypothetical protein
MESLGSTSKEKLLIRVCHSCLKINESHHEIERCSHCKKAFLPLRYFEKIHKDREEKWENHFSSADLLHDDDLIKGLYVLW